MIQVPISVGELYDKLSILVIKEHKIKDEAKLKLVKKEFILLLQLVTPYFKNKRSLILFSNLKKINKNLWNVEDKLRKKEADKYFDLNFINLARKVYRLNDRRFYYKNKINELFNSEIREVKQYVKYK